MRTMLRLAMVAAWAAGIWAAGFWSADAKPLQAAETATVFIGTGGGASRGIYRTRLNLETGRLAPAELAAEIGSPGFLAQHPQRPVLYSVGQLEGPVVAAYQIGDDGSLKLLNTRPNPAGGAAHLGVDRTGQVLLTAQYGAGSTAMFRLSEDGAIDRHVVTRQHPQPERPVSQRQDKPHAHWVGVSPDNRFALVPDLGLDRVLIYRLTLGEAPMIDAHGMGEAPAGSGPRHMKFHPNGRWIYVLNELSLTISLFSYDQDAGSMKLEQTVPTVPEAEKSKERAVSASEVRIHPNGKFVYAANRGHDTITVLAIDSETGRLTEVEREPVRGATPRNFNLDPSGRWLLAAGQLSNTLAVFAVDPESGELSFHGQVINVPTPICVEFAK